MAPKLQKLQEEMNQNLNPRQNDIWVKTALFWKSLKLSTVQKIVQMTQNHTEEQNMDNQSCSSGGPQNKNPYPELCRAIIDRPKVSNLNVCLIANAILRDLGLSSQNASIFLKQTSHNKSSIMSL